MKTLKVLSLAALALTASGLSAFAWDHGHYWGGPRIGFGFGFGAPYPYYYHPYYYEPGYVERGRVVHSVESDVQYALSRKGYYGGPIDGDVGPRTRAAIRAYQVDKALPVTGRIDRPLLYSLGLI